MRFDFEQEAAFIELRRYPSSVLCANFEAKRYAVIKGAADDKAFRSTVAGDVGVCGRCVVHRALCSAHGSARRLLAPAPRRNNPPLDEPGLYCAFLWCAAVGSVSGSRPTS